MSDALSKPERHVARDQGKEVRELVKEDGGCCYCIHRAGVLETIGRRAACGLSPPKQFPACVGSAQGFTFDEQAFQEGAGRNLKEHR